MVLVVMLKMGVKGMVCRECKRLLFCSNDDEEKETLCFARMATRRKRLCVSNICLPHEISMEKAFANCSYGNAAHDDEGIETLGIVYLVRWVF